MTDPHSLTLELSVRASDVAPVSGPGVSLPPSLLDDLAEPASEPSGPDPLLGTVVAGRYRIVERVGRGGMGIVYKAEHLRLGKLVAMKLLADGLSRRPEVARRFEREASLAARLSHPNSVQVFDYGVSDGLTWLIMELVPGRDLAQVLRAEGPLPAARAARLAAQVCGSLAEAHAHGIVHRDIKPANVMVATTAGEREVAKVLDFGLARLWQGAESNDVSGRDALLGTPAYMAPEQIEGSAVDGRTDVYALGAMLYRMVTGEPVFRSHLGLWDILTRHLTETPVPPRQRAPHLDIPEALDAIVLRALAKRPDNRFQSVLELRAALLALAGPGRDERPSRAPLPLPSDHATRDDVAAYERRLHRHRVLSRALVTLVLVSTFIALGALARASVPVWTALTSPASAPPPAAAPPPATATATGARPVELPARFR